eukprot:1378593-Rhodomonas_salina.1
MATSHTASAATSLRAHTHTRPQPQPRTARQLCNTSAPSSIEKDHCWQSAGAGVGWGSRG